ncbi:MAG: hypothetical protein MK097_13650, partial [Dechloromonas sp.]|nr:hypothetical protein [Dechloromonas sp.]
RQSTLAIGPIAGRKVKQHLFHIGRLQALGKLVSGPIIREQILDTLKTGGGGKTKTLPECMLGEQETEVGSELWHGQDSLSHGLSV